MNGKERMEEMVTDDSESKKGQQMLRGGIKLKKALKVARQFQEVFPWYSTALYSEHTIAH